MATYGKHAKDPRQVQVGKHGVAVKSNVSIVRVVLAIVLVAVICLVPFSLAASNGRATSPEVQQGYQAYAEADSVARAAFPLLSDAAQQPTDLGNELPSQQATFTENITEKMQNSVMSGGCEIVALGIALESMGIDADLNLIVKDHLNIDGHFATGYSGSPYSKGGGYPQGVTAAANSYLESIGVSARAHNLSGESFDTLQTLVNGGYPVLVWTTMGFKDPQFAGAFDNGLEWYSNEHCVVLYGFDGSNVLVSDPLEGLVSRDAERFADIYVKCGSMALAIY